MKKFLLSLSIACITMLLLLTISFTPAQGQDLLFNGLKVGMTQNQFKTTVKNSSNMSYKLTSKGSPYFTCEIGNRDYVVFPLFYNNLKLYSLRFVCADAYNARQYNINIKENGSELFDLLAPSYGKSVINRWVDSYEIPKGKSMVLAAFQHGDVFAAISVNENAGKYFIDLIIASEHYADMLDDGESNFRL